MLATLSANSVTSICCGFVVPPSRTDASHKSRRRRTYEQRKRIDSLVLFTSPTTLCVVCCLYYDMVDFMDKLAEFVCGTIPMLYETKTQNMGVPCIYVFCVPNVRHFEEGAYTL